MASLIAVRDTAGTAGHLTLRLAGSITQALLTRVPARFYGGIHEVLLTGLAVAVADWCRRRGAGRAGAGGAAGSWRVTAARRCLRALDLSRTVGWFTSLYPVRLEVGGVDVAAALAGGPALGRR